MNSTSVTSAAQVGDLNRLDPSTRSALSVRQDDEFRSDDGFIRSCGLNELLFAVETEGTMELSTEPFL